MVDALTGIGENVPFNFSSANSLISLCRSAASAIDGQSSSRSRWAASGLADFRGHFADLFGSNASIQEGDAALLSARLREVAHGAEQLRDDAHKEQRRREIAREWKRRRDQRNLLDQAHDFFFGDEDPPVGPPSEPIQIRVTEPHHTPRQTPQPGSGGGAGSTTSANPANLRRFATNSAGANDALRSWPGRLRHAYDQFVSGCHWGSLQASGVWSGYDRYLMSNDEDVRWANVVAGAFEAAGGTGAVSTLSDSALAAALNAAGVNQTRQVLTIDPPEAFGHPPTTGYADDPVNTATGNFLETEIDLGFSGGAQILQFSRTYNSVNTSIGAFGVGWSSWTESRLNFADDAARWVQPDGRHIVFPRLGNGWDRATTEAYWLAQHGSALLVTDNRGGRWRFTTSGQLQSFDCGPGTGVHLCYTDGRLVAMRHERGREVALNWDGALIAAARSNDGRCIEYEYDDQARLVSANGPLGSRRYRWNDAGLIESVTDPDGVVEVANTYDAQGRVATQRARFGRVTRYAYLPGRVTVVSDPDGTRSNTWISDERGRLVGVVDAEDRRQSMAYDRFGNLVMATERDRSTNLHEYDHRGRRVHTRVATGADLRWVYDDCDRVLETSVDDAATTRYRYVDESRNPSEMVDPSGGTTRMEWSDGLLVGLIDPTGVALQFGYDSFGDLVETTDGDGNVARLERDEAGRVSAAISPGGNRTSYSYNPSGTLASVKAADGGVWRYEYSTAGRRVATIDPLGGRTIIEHGAAGEEAVRTDAIGRSVHRTLDDLGNLAAVVLPDGSAWKYTHDAMSRLTAVVDPIGGTSRTEHDGMGAPSAVIDPSGARRDLTLDAAAGSLRVEDADGVVELGFDRSGRIESVTDTGAVTVVHHDRCGRPVELLDASGNLTTISRDASGRIVAVTTPGGMVTRYAYDRCGRLASVIGPGGDITTYGWDADRRLTSTVGPTGETSTFSYDPVGRVTQSVIPGRGVWRGTYDLAGRLIRSYDTWNGHRRFTYDDAGQLVTTRNGNGGVTSYSRDPLGRVQSVTNPDGGTTRLEWSTTGNLLAETDPLGRATRAGYDAAGRQAWQVDPAGRRVDWSYDQRGRLVSMQHDQRIISAVRRDLSERIVELTDPSSVGGPATQRFEWDTAGRLIRHDTAGRSTSWAYDADGRRILMTTQDGSAVRYGHDEAGHLVSVSHPLLGTVRLAYDTAGRLASAATSDGAERWLYANGWLAGHESSTGIRTDVQRDPDGRIVAICAAGRRTEFRYDDAGQLIAAATPGSDLGWEYDSCGRLLKETAAGIAVAENRYDVAGQLVSRTSAEGITQYAYDPAGRRIRETHPDGSGREYHWSTAGWLAAVTDTDGTGCRFDVDSDGLLRHVDDAPVSWDMASPVPMLLGVGTTPALSVGPLTAVGDTWYSSGWRTTIPTIPGNPWPAAPASSSAAGIEIGAGGLLGIAALLWLGARSYDPASKSFVSTDPLPPTAGAGWTGNPFAYAGNNPLGLSDPFGMHPVTDAELKAYAGANQGFLAQAGDWWSNNWEYVAAGAAIVGGIALMCTGVGGPAGIALMAASGALMGGGISVASQKSSTGQVDWGKVGVDTALGAVTGMIGGAGYAWASAASKGGTAALRTTLAVNSIAGAGGSELSYLANNHDHLSWKGAISSFVGGGVGGLVGGASGPIGGQIASNLGHKASGLLASTFSGAVTFAGGFAGSSASQCIESGEVDVRRSAASGAWAVGGDVVLRHVLPQSHGTDNLDQLSRFGTRTMDGLRASGRNATRNSQDLWIGVSRGLSAWA
jgi:RHS repeat-associated protein